jgi:ketosteroid isomerase-like protein
MDQPQGDQQDRVRNRHGGLDHARAGGDASPDSSSEDVAVVRRAFEAFADRDLARLEALTSEAAIVYNPITGVVVGRTRYVGRDSLLNYLADVERVWSHLELLPRTFSRPRPGEVLVVGRVRMSRGGEVHTVPAAWRWTVANGEVTFVEVLRTPEALAALG